MKTNDFKSRTRISIVIMKMFVVLSMLIFNYGSLYAQKCNLKTMKDEYTSPPSISIISEDVNIGGVFKVLGDELPWHLDMKFFLDDGQLSLLITHHQSRSGTTSLLNSIFFVFKDGTVIRKEEPIGHNDFSAAGTLTGFLLTNEELQLFASKELMKFKVEFKSFSERPIFENEFNQKCIDKIKKDASCMLLELNSNTHSDVAAKKNVKEENSYKCSYEMDKIDGFSKKREILTKPALLADVKVDGGHVFLNVCGKNTGSINGLLFSYCFNTTKIGNASEADIKSKMLFDQVEILLENDDIVNLKTAEISEFLNQYDKNNSVWSYKAFSIPDEAIWQKIKTNPVKTVRASINGKVLFTQEVEKIYSMSFMNVINCIDALGIPKSQ